MTAAVTPRLTPTLAAALVAIAALASLAVWQAARAPSPTPEIQAAWDNLNACRQQTEELDRVFAERYAALQQAIQDATPHIAYTTNLRLHPDGRQALYAFRDILWARDGVARAHVDILEAANAEAEALTVFAIELEKLGILPEDGTRPPATAPRPGSVRPNE